MIEIPGEHYRRWKPKAYNEKGRCWVYRVLMKNDHIPYQINGNSLVNLGLHSLRLRNVFNTSKPALLYYFYHCTTGLHPTPLSLFHQKMLFSLILFLPLLSGVYFCCLSPVRVFQPSQVRSSCWQTLHSLLSESLLIIFCWLLYIKSLKVCESYVTHSWWIHW